MLSDGVTCRLCGGTKARCVHTTSARRYHCCDTCQLVFVDDDDVLSEDAERREYDKHRNTVDDAGYRAFLARAATALLQALPHEARSAPLVGLDFGCGPCPLLARMLVEQCAAWRVHVYDKYYFADSAAVLSRRDATLAFVTATEVAEHLRAPLHTFVQLWRLLRCGAVLVVMTKRVHADLRNFATWHYIRDPTHIAFYSNATFAWLADYLQRSSGVRCDIELHSKDIVLLHKRHVMHNTQPA